MSIQKYDDVNVQEINYSKPEKNGPSYFASMSYGDNLRPLYIQTTHPHQATLGRQYFENESILFHLILCYIYPEYYHILANEDSV